MALQYPQLMLLPKVSCICLTFGRPRHLEEAIESFLRQNYSGESELIVVNDFPNQQLLYTADPRVKIINRSARFGSLGAKRNFAVCRSTGSVIVNWDDDDISLPARMRRAAEAIQSGMKFFRPAWSWFMVADKRLELRHRKVEWPQCAFSIDVFRHVRGYPRVTVAEDRLFAQRVSEAGYPIDFAPDGPEDATLIYRMLPDNPHATGIVLGKYSYAEIQKRLQPGAQEGRIELQPGWRRDYAALCRPPAAGAVTVPAVPSGNE